MILLFIEIIVEVRIRVWLFAALQFALEPLWKLYEACSPKLMCKSGSVYVKFVVTADCWQPCYACEHVLFLRCSLPWSPCGSCMKPAALELMCKPRSARQSRA